MRVALQAIGEGWRACGTAFETVLAQAGFRLSRRDARVCQTRAQPERAIGSVPPFDEARDGFVPGEGGAAFVLESLESARARGAAVFAELLGFGASLDGGALTAPDESARFAEQAVRGALADAGLEPHAVDWVSAHGTGTPLNDRSEAVLLERVFAQAEARPAVTALKSWIGHGSAACGGMELALMLAAWRSGRLPPIRNLRAPCSGLLDFAVATRPFPGPVGVLENFGFGGQNAALVVRCGDD
ncbi:MAG: hypothetical protein ACLSAH_16055 [Bilophila wadsworthia]